MELITTQDKKLTRYVAILAFLYPVICLAFGKGYMVIPAIALVSSLLMLKWTYKSLNDNRPAIYLVLIFLLYFIVSIITTVAHGERLSALDGPSRFVLVIPILMMFITFPPCRKLFFYGIPLGGIVAGLSALYQHFGYGMSRVFLGDGQYSWTKGYQAIQAGNMSITFALLSSMILFYSVIKKRHSLTIISLIGVLMGCIASLLSGSRGGWIAIPFIVIYFIIVNRQFINKKMLLSIIVLFGLCAVAIGNSHYFQKRVNEAISDTTLYISGENKNTSLGIRYDLWKSALYTFKASPVVGMTLPEELAYRQTLVKKGIIDAENAKFNSHSHNQFLEALSKQGILGFVALVLLIFIPLFQFEKLRILSKKACNLELNIMAQLGTVLLISLILFSLSQAMLNHNSGNMFYAMMLAIIAGSCFSTKFESKSKCISEKIDSSN